MTALPHHERIISALCHYDLVGFQTEIDAANFARYLETECRYTGNREHGYDTGERRVRIGAFPVGVEVETVQPPGAALVALVIRDRTCWRACPAAP